MLIVCPSCARRYLIDEAIVGGQGRTVRCASCRTPFFVPPPEPGAAATDDEAGFDAGALRSTIGTDDNLESRRTPRDVDGPATAEAALHPALAPRPPLGGGKGRGRLGSALGRIKRPLPALPPKLAALAAPAALSLCVVLAVTAIVKRETVVRVAPQTARLFAAMQMPVNLRGLVFENIRSETIREAEGRLLVVTGDIRNVAGRPVAVPNLMLRVRSADGESLYSWTAEPARAELGPDETVSFRARLASPPVDGQNVMVAFVKDGDATVAGASQR